MLYDTYQVHSDVLAPIRLMAEFFRGVLTQPWPLIENAPLVRSAAAAMELLSNAGMSHDRPEFGIRKVIVDGEEVGVTEEIVASHPFCQLLHFRKEMTRDEPTVFVVKNGSKICDCTCSGMPGPSSAISTTMYSSSEYVATQMLPLPSTA